MLFDIKDSDTEFPIAAPLPLAPYDASLDVEPCMVFNPPQIDNLTDCFVLNRFCKVALLSTRLYS
jgi:hypothetical protein